MKVQNLVVSCVYLICHQELFFIFAFLKKKPYFIIYLK